MNVSAHGFLRRPTFYGWYRAYSLHKVSTLTDQPFCSQHTECPLCTTTLKDQTALWTCPGQRCGATFHTGCILRWWFEPDVEEGSFSSCPVCSKPNTFDRDYWKCYDCGDALDHNHPHYMCFICGRVLHLACYSAQSMHCAGCGGDESIQVREWLHA